MSSVSLSVSVVVGADSGGHPTVKASSCSLDIGHLDITFHGGARCIIIINEIETNYLTTLFLFSWLYNLFSDNIAGSLKGSLSDQASLCVTCHNSCKSELCKCMYVRSFLSIRFSVCESIECVYGVSVVYMCVFKRSLCIVARSAYQ